MKGFIYKITSANGKSYIGQVVEFIKRGDKKGIMGRWRQHIHSSKNKKECSYLHRAMSKYGYEKFKIEQLMKCNEDKLDLFEELFIKTHNTLAPTGYNLQKGGTFTKHSDETCKKRSDTLKKLLKDPNKREIWSKAKKGVRLKEKRKCKKVVNQDLPKYVYYRESHGGKYKGYVVESPKGNKRFGKSTITLEENLKLAKEFIKSLE